VHLGVVLLLEINDHNSLTAYIGFFSLLWLTWYQVSLYDVRFSSDSVFERVAKAIHFGVMVGFAVIGPQWKPGQDIPDFGVSVTVQIANLRHPANCTFLLGRYTAHSA
jgi:hypothetical protein